MLALGAGSAQASVPDPPARERVPSVLEIPITLDLDPLFREAETLLPQQVGHWREWRREHGIETRYRAWRGPLAIQLQGGLLRVQSHVRYWVQARKRILGSFDLKVGCGVDEPPRQAVVGLLVSLSWGPDWTLRPGFQVLPTRFIDRCEVTAADIDVTPIIGDLFRRRMEEALRAALADLRPRMEEARRRAADYWQALQRPVELVPGVWLSADPLAVALAPPFGSGRQLQTVLGLALAPRLVPRVPSTREPRPLPSLQTFFPSGTGMRFDLALEVDLDKLEESLSSSLTGRTLTLEGHEIGVGAVRLRGEGGELILTAALTGDAAGQVEIRARPGFDAGTQQLRLDDLDFVYDSDDPDLALMVNIFYPRIQAALTDGANGLLDEQLERLRRGLVEAFSRSLPERLDPDFSSLRLAELDLEVGDTAVRLRGSATGSLSLTVR